MSQQRTVKLTTSAKNKETNVTASSGKAEREVNDIMENRTNKRREPIVVIMGHSDSEELSKDKRGSRGQKMHPPYTPYFIGNSSRVIFNTTDLKGDQTTANHIA